MMTSVRSFVTGEIKEEKTQRSRKMYIGRIQTVILVIHHGFFYSKIKSDRNKYLNLLHFIWNKPFLHGLHI